MRHDPCFPKNKNICSQPARARRYYTSSSRMFFFWLCKGNLQVENASFAQLTLDPHAAAMPFRNGTDDGESQAGSMLGARFPLFAAIKLFEQARQIVRGDADAGILHFKEQVNWR